jgi:hypothetical protein
MAIRFRLQSEALRRAIENFSSASVRDASLFANGNAPCGVTVGKLKHWRGFQGIYGLGGAPVLEFGVVSGTLTAPCPGGIHKHSRRRIQLRRVRFGGDVLCVVEVHRRVGQSPTPNELCQQRITPPSLVMLLGFPETVTLPGFRKLSNCR